MATRTHLLALLNGLPEQVDLRLDELQVLTLRVGGGSGTLLTKVILDKLVALQDGTDFATGTNSHTHDGRYFTETELGSTTNGSDGSKLIGDFNNYTNFTPGAATVKGALTGADTAIGTKLPKAGGQMSGAIDMNSNFITNLPTPTLSGHAASKGYVDSISQGIKWKNSVRAMSSSDIALTGGATLSIDGVSLANDDRVLLTAQSPASENGMYLVSGIGSTYALTRTSDADSAAEVLQMAVFVEEGTSYADSGWVCTTDAPITLDTTALSFVQFSGAGSVNAGAGLTQTGNTIDVIAADASLTVGANNVAVQRDAAGAIGLSGSGVKVNVDAVGIEISSNAIQLKDSGVTTAKIAAAAVDENKIAASVAGAGISGGAGTALAVELATNPGLEFDAGGAAGKVQVKVDAAGAITRGASGLAAAVDASTIEINANALRVKDAGITAAKIAAAAVDESKLAASVAGAGLAGGAGTALSVNVDGSTLEIPVDTLRVKDSGITLAKMAADSVDENKIKSSSHDASLAGGSGAVLSVNYAPSMLKSMVAGEAFAADTSFLVRMAVNGETAGRVYKADMSSAAAAGKFYVMGIAKSVAGAIAGGAIEVTLLGTHTLGASDANFNSTDIGKAVYLSSSTGGFSITAPSSSGDGVFRIGSVENTTKIFMFGQQLNGIV
jgi:hypothetical protein